MKTDNRTKVCVCCVMDTSDPKITFDDSGLCKYCQNFRNVISPDWSEKVANTSSLHEKAEEIKQATNGSKYDCIIGISGGLDSSFTAYVAKEVMGLKPLLFHVDAGWNTRQAVENIECLVDGLGLDLYTEVINWDKMRELQIAFLKSQIPDQDLPQDAAFFSSLYSYAAKNGFKFIFTGANFSTECCREPEEWGGYLGIDKRLFHDIFKKFGDGDLRHFPLVDIMTYKLFFRYFYGISVFAPLNYINFFKKNGEELLSNKFGWQSFQHKHHESVFTRFYESFWLRKKFGFDKRKAHFSSLVMTGQASRDLLLERLETSELNDLMTKNEFDFVADKLNMTVGELNELFSAPNKTFSEYKNKKWLINFGAKLLHSIGLEKRLL